MLHHSGIDYLMIARVKLIPVVLGGTAPLEMLETNWVLPKNRTARSARTGERLMSPVMCG